MSFKGGVYYLIVLVCCISFQLLILNNISTYGLFSPMIYFYLILVAPIKKYHWATLLLAFFLGITIDFFSNTGGLHAAATTALSFFRISIIAALEPVSGYEKDDHPLMRKFGFRWTLYYLTVCVLIHHTVFFLMEAFSFRGFHITFLKIFLSGLGTLFLMWVLFTMTSKQR